MSRFNALYRTFIPSLGILFTLLFTGCTRPESNQSKLNFSLPNKSSQMKLGDVSKLATLSHVVINVTGSGMPGPFVFNWDAENPNPSCTGDVCSLVVPSGDNRLIQVLAVYEDIDTAGQAVMDFQYGDVVKSLSTQDEYVSVGVTSLMSGGSVAVTEAEIVGRYLETADWGPTGKLEIRYSPPNKPSLLLSTEEMYGGWFRAFGLIGVPFQYVLNGKVIFNGDPAQLDQKLGQNLMKVSWPEYYESYNGSSGEKLRSAKVQYIGFIGPAASSTTHKVCYPDATGGVAGAYVALNSTTKINWDPVSTNPAYVRVINGGLSGSDLSACESGGAFLPNSYAIDPVGRGMPDVYGPFMKREINDTSNTLSWEYLLGATSGLTGFSVFVIDGQNNSLDQYEERMNGHGYRCGELEADWKAADRGVYHIGEVTPSTTSLAYDAQYASFSKVVCPRTSTGYMNAAAYRYSGFGGGGGPMGPYLRVELIGATSNFDGYDLNQNQCYEAKLMIFENGTAKNLTSDLTVQFNTQPAGLNFYTGSCAGAPASNVIVSAGQSQSAAGILWVKGSSISSNLEINLTLTGTDNVNFAPMHNYLHVVTAPAMLTSSPSFYDFGSISTGTPTDFTFTITNSGGQTASSISASIPGPQFTFKDSFYPGTGGTCTASLSPAGTCTIVVTFAPPSATSYNDNLNINFHNGSSFQPLNIPLSGMGGP